MFFRISSSICALLLVVVALNGCGGKAPEAADNKPASADGGGGLTLPDKPIEASSAAAPAASEPAPSAPEPAAAAAPAAEPAPAATDGAAASGGDTRYDSK